MPTMCSVLEMHGLWPYILSEVKIYTEMMLNTEHVVNSSFYFFPGGELKVVLNIQINKNQMFNRVAQNHSCQCIISSYCPQEVHIWAPRYSLLNR